MTTDTLAPARRGLPTSYAGHVFRSRLEARFAVLFDAMGIRWEYEPEGFELPHGLYVPDFWLPDPGAWVEVKPDPELALEERAWSLAVDLATATGHPVAVATGLDHFGLGEPVFCRTHGGRPEYVYLTQVTGRPVFATDRWAGDVGPYLLRDKRVASGVAKAKAATFERPDRIPAYPLVAR